MARGVIARTIERIDRDPAVNRTDILYICSNSDLANQNLKRLNILGAQATPFASRLTLLARHSRRLKPSVDPGRTAVNLVSFTPGTSFSKGFRGGNAEERALLSLLLWDILVGLGHEGSRRRKTALHLILRGGVRSVERFRGYIGELAWELSEHGGADPSIVHDFTRRVQVPDERTGVSLLDRVVTLMDLTEGRRKHLPTGIGDEAWQLIGDLRSALAESSVAVLKPDLIILDEFQRFRELMNPDTEAGELAHHLFDHSSARVLLLSATPYKPFTYGEEEEDHARDFHQLLDFLAGRTDPVIDVRKTRELLGAYRESVTRGDVDADVRELLSSNLRTVMSRWERPRIGIEAMAA
ncbi:MAG TPA: helicase, partial [Intrasporangiaceae bacterium]|nr:helicase [Intrasporangiaceae bacterium]